MVARRARRITVVFWAFVFAFAALMLTACDPEGGNGGVSVAVTFEDDDVSPTRIDGSLSPAAGQTVGTTATPVDTSMEPLTQFYADIGEMVGSYTPTEFRMFIVEIGLYNPTPDGDGVELDAPLASDSPTNFEKHYADFVQEVVIRGGEPAPAGTYSRMWFMFSAYRRQMGSNTFDGVLPIDPEIEVKIPGYGHVDTDGDGSLDGPAWSEDPYFGDDTFRFAPWRLQPDAYNWTYEEDGTDKTIDPIEHFAYFADATSYRGIFPGIGGVPESWDTAEPDTLGTPHLTAKGFGSAIIVPSEPVLVSAYATELLVRVKWDLGGIIEVYDNGTAGDKSDDIVVFANRFWERLDLTVETR